MTTRAEGRTWRVAVAAGLLVATIAGAADAAARPRVDLVGATPGTFALDVDGTAVIRDGTVTGRPFGGPYTATLAADDGSLPEPGTCEPATATLVVDPPRRPLLSLAAVGVVCGEHVTTTWKATHRFTGRYEVVASSRRKIRGTDGFLEGVLAVEDEANVFAIDT